MSSVSARVHYCFPLFDLLVIHLGTNKGIKEYLLTAYFWKDSDIFMDFKNKFPSRKLKTTD